MVNELDLPLRGVKVLDLGCYLAGPLAGMLLTDQGAETIKVDPPGGEVFKHPVNAVLNRGKSQVEIDLHSSNGKQQLLSLLKEADVLIENFSAGVMEKLKLSQEELRNINPSLITVSIKGFDNKIEKFKDIKAFEGIIAALSGQYTDIHAVRKHFGLGPLYTALPIASIYAAIHSANSAVLALRHRELGRGATKIEVNLYDSALSAMSSIFMQVEKQPKKYDVPRLSPLLKHGVLPGLRKLNDVIDIQKKSLDIARKSYPALMNSYSCKDRNLLYVFAIDNAKITEALLKCVGLYEKTISLGFVKRNPYSSGDLRNNLAETGNLSRARQKQLKTLLARAFSTKTAFEWEHILNKAGVPCSVQRTTDEWLDLQELQTAGIVVSVNDTWFGNMLQPGVQTWLSDVRSDLATPKSREKLLPEKLSFKSISRDKIAVDARHCSTENKSEHMLKGLKVIDMCSMVAGPVSGRTLAEYGARVIKIEAPKPNHGPRMTCWYGLDVNQGKESIVLDLNLPDGRLLFESLLSDADVLLTNSSPAGLTKLNISESYLKKVNPDLIFARLNSYNGPLSGPWNHRVGYDPVLQAASGIMTRYGDKENPELHAIASCVDALAGYSHALGVSLALYRKVRENSTPNVETSLAMAANLIQLPYAFSYSGKKQKEASGQNARGELPLYRIYKTSDSWVFVACLDANEKDLPWELQPNRRCECDADLIEYLADKIKKIKTDRLIALFTSVNISVVEVKDVDGLRREWGNGIGELENRFSRRVVDGVGNIGSVSLSPVKINDEYLPRLDAAEKSGLSSARIIREHSKESDNGDFGVTVLSKNYLPK